MTRIFLFLGVIVVFAGCDGANTSPPDPASKLTKLAEKLIDPSTGVVMGEYWDLHLSVDEFTNERQCSVHAAINKGFENNVRPVFYVNGLVGTDGMRLPEVLVGGDMGKGIIVEGWMFKIDNGVAYREDPAQGFEGGRSSFENMTAEMVKGSDLLVRGIAGTQSYTTQIPLAEFALMWPAAVRACQE